MRVTIKKGTARGTVAAPPSKSMAHRMLICAAMSEGVSHIHGISDCEDVEATLSCLDSLGIVCEKQGSEITVYGKGFSTLSPHDVLKCRESGSTLRFLIPPAMLLSKTVMFVGEKQLMRRPMGVYEALALEKGLVFIQDGDTIVVKGPLQSGSFTVAGNVSSQFISGLLFALPLLEGDSEIHISTNIESRSYIQMTMYVLSLFGVSSEWKDERTIFVRGGQVYRGADVTVEGDFSGAAFLEALNVLGSDVHVTGLAEESTQGDSVYRRFFPMFERGIPSVSLSDSPDLGPILFALAAAKKGGVFTETRRLRIKESDRSAVMAEELSKFGVCVGVEEDSVAVYPAEFHAPTKALSGHGDHRIVMALSVLLTVTGGTIEGAEAVAKSYPEFFSALEALGIEVAYEDR